MQTLGRRSQVWDSLAVFGFADLVDQSVFDPQKSVCGLSQSLIGDRRGEGSDLWNVSLALDQLGERAQAIQHAEQALPIFEQIEDPKATKVRAQLAEWREQTNT